MKTPRDVTGVELNCWIDLNCQRLPLPGFRVSCFVGNLPVTHPSQ